jgi:hypothetical protein
VQIRIVTNALDTYRERVSTCASPEEAERRIMTAILGAIALSLPQRAPRETLTVIRCPARGKDIRLRLGIIVHKDSIDIVEVYPPFKSWDPTRGPRRRSRD